MTELTRDFYTRDGLTVARELIGKTLVHWVGGRELRGIITETEAYMGVTDKASHAYGGRRTKRTETMYLMGGHAYVYLIYGIYSCMNITASVDGNPEAVLIRCVMPEGDVQGILDQVRTVSRKKNLPSQADEMTPAELYKLTDGPGKLCCGIGNHPGTERRRYAVRRLHRDRRRMARTGDSDAAPCGNRLRGGSGGLSVAFFRALRERDSGAETDSGIVNMHRIFT